MNNQTTSSAEAEASLQIQTPPVTNPVDAEVDLEVLKIIPRRFSIEDENSANWLVRKVVSAREYAIHVKDWAHREQRRAEREEMTLLYLFGRQLERWAREQIDSLGGRRKSLCLPAAKVGFRTQNPKLVIDDDLAVLAWARTHLPEAIKVVESLSKTAVNEHFAKTGEIPPATRLEAAYEKFGIS